MVAQKFLLIRIVIEKDGVFKSKLKSLLQEQLAYLNQYSKYTAQGFQASLGPSPYKKYFEAEPSFILWMLHLLDHETLAKGAQLDSGVESKKNKVFQYDYSTYPATGAYKFDGTYTYSFNPAVFLENCGIPKFAPYSTFIEHKAQSAVLKFPSSDPLEAVKPRQVFKGREIDFQLNGKIHHPFEGESPWDELPQTTIDPREKETLETVSDCLPQELPENYIKEKRFLLTPKN